jgi:hypothetical protein
MPHRNWRFRKSSGETLPKRTESTLVTECLQYIQLWKNSGRVVWFARLNSGAIRTRNENGIWRRIRLCPEGTPDIIAITNTGAVLWFECKETTGLSPIQQAFFDKIGSVPNNFCFEIREASQVEGPLARLSQEKSNDR